MSADRGARPAPPTPDLNAIMAEQGYGPQQRQLVGEEASHAADGYNALVRDLQGSVAEPEVEA